MNNRLDVLLERIPSQFTVEEGSNNYKLLSIVAEGSNENRLVYETILKFWDVDLAEGVGLDRLGKDEGISRGSMTDDEYRKMIKIQCILNMSDGDIPTMNIILDAYMDERFIGLEDGWKYIEPASLLSNVTAFAGALPNHLIGRIKSAGVRFFWQVKFEMQKLVITHFPYHYPIYYHKCGELTTAPIHGLGIGSIIGMSDMQYRYPVYYNPSDTFNTAGKPGAALQSDLTLGELQYDYPNYYPVTNVIESENFIEGGMTGGTASVQQTHAGMRMLAPVCGIFTGGGM